MCLMIEKDYGFYCFWTIKDFGFYSLDDIYIHLMSEKFHSSLWPGTKWYFRLCRKESGSLSFHLCKKNTYFSFKVKVSFFIQSYFGWISIGEKNQEASFCQGQDCFGYSNFIEQVEIFSQRHIYLPNNYLTLGVHVYDDQCELPATYFSLTSSMINCKQVKHLPKTSFQLEECAASKVFPFLASDQASKKDSDLQSVHVGHSCKNQDTFNDFDDLMRLFKEKKFSCVTIRAKDIQFSVYKALLCARSPVFNAMFDKDMRENNENIVDVDDVDGHTMSLLLKFLHVEPMGDLKWDEAVKLYYAADKYQVDLLKEVCVSSMEKNIGKENVCEAFLLADLHQDSNLKRLALMCFCKNSKSILRSNEWKRFMLNHTELATDLLSEYAAM